METNLIFDENVSHAWARAFITCATSQHQEILPLVVRIGTTFGYREDEKIRNMLDVALQQKQAKPIGEVANTIFPDSLWNRRASRETLFSRFTRIWPRIRKSEANRYGHYFRRMIAFGAKDDRTGVNQLEHVISTWAKGNSRRSAFQVSIFDPTEDHTDQRQRGFPCLHQVSIVPGKEGLSICGYYGSQTLLEKAYGNYLGLIRLGVFIAQEFNMTLTHVTCIASVARLANKQIPALERRRLVTDLSRLL
jgi:thymidylate synthase